MDAGRDILLLSQATSFASHLTLLEKGGTGIGGMGVGHATVCVLRVAAIEPLWRRYRRRSNE